MYQSFGKTHYLTQYAGQTPVYYPAGQPIYYPVAQPVSYIPVYSISQPIYYPAGQPIYYPAGQPITSVIKKHVESNKWEMKKITTLPSDQYAKIGYKVIGSDYEYIAELGIPKDALTNIFRPGIIDYTYAKFRANKVHVLSIFHRKSGALIREEYSGPFGDDRKFKYETGVEIETSFTADINIVCGEGIHFFLSEEGANNFGDAMNITKSRTPHFPNIKVKVYEGDGSHCGWWITDTNGNTRWQYK